MIYKSVTSKSIYTVVLVLFMVFKIKSPLQLDWHFGPQTRTLALDSSSKEETPLKWLTEATLTPVQNPRWRPSLRRAKSAFWPAWPHSRIIGAAAFKWAWRRTAAAAARSRTCTPSPAGWTRAAAARCARSSRRKARCSFCTVSAGEKAGLIRSQWNRPKNVNGDPAENVGAAPRQDLLLTLRVLESKYLSITSGQQFCSETSRLWVLFPGQVRTETAVIETTVSLLVFFVLSWNFRLTRRRRCLTAAQWSLTKNID